MGPEDYPKNRKKSGLLRLTRISLRLLLTKAKEFRSTNPTLLTLHQNFYCDAPVYRCDEFDAGKD